MFIFQVSILSLAVEGSANLTALRSLRTLRALRPLRAISRWQGMKVNCNYKCLHVWNFQFGKGIFYQATSIKNILGIF